MAQEPISRDKLLALRHLLAASSALVVRATDADGNPQQIADELSANNHLIEQILREWRESIN